MRLRALVNEGLPRRGRDLYPLKGSVQWYVAYWRDKALNREENDTNKKIGSARAALLQAKLKTATGEYIDRAEVVAVFTAAFEHLAQAMANFPRAMGRELNLGPDAVRVMNQRMDEFRQNFVRDSAEFLDVTDGEDGPEAEQKTA